MHAYLRLYSKPACVRDNVVHESAFKLRKSEESAGTISLTGEDLRWPEEELRNFQEKCRLVDPQRKQGDRLQGVFEVAASVFNDSALSLPYLDADENDPDFGHLHHSLSGMNDLNSRDILATLATEELKSGFRHLCFRYA